MAVDNVLWHGAVAELGKSVLQLRHYASLISFSHMTLPPTLSQTTAAES